MSDTIDSKDKCLKSLTKAQQCSKDPNYDKHWRVNTLPPDVNKRVCDDLKMLSPMVIAEELQEQGFHNDITTLRLRNILESYRAERIPKHQILNPYLVERLTRDVKKNINIFNELSDLIMLQRERIRKAVLIEEAKGELLPDTSKQLHVQSRMLKIYADVSIKAGLMSEFVQGFLRDSQQADDYQTFEVRDMFMRFFLYKKQAGQLEECLDVITSNPDDLLAEQ